MSQGGKKEKEKGSKVDERRRRTIGFGVVRYRKRERKKVRERGVMGEERGPREQERASWRSEPVKRCTRRAERGGGTRGSAPAAAAVFVVCMCARGDSRARRWDLAVALSLSFSSWSRALARVLARTPPVPWRAPTLINAKLRRRRWSAYFPARCSPRIAILHRLN